MTFGEYPPLPSSASSSDNTYVHSVTADYTVDVSNGKNQILTLQTPAIITLPAVADALGTQITIINAGGQSTIAPSGNEFIPSNIVKQSGSGPYTYQFTDTNTASITIVAVSDVGGYGDFWQCISAVGDLWFWNDGVHVGNSKPLFTQGGVDFGAQSAPSNPAAGHWIIYTDSGDGKLKAKNSAGTVREIAIP